MAVTQISKIQIRRGRKDNLPDALSVGEMAMTTDTGEVFIGAPDLPVVQHRAGTIYPYRNIRLITEFDLVHTLSDHVVTTGPLERLTAPARDAGAVSTFYFRYTGLALPTDSGGNATTRVIVLSWDGTGAAPGDLRGRYITDAHVNLASDSLDHIIPEQSVSVRHTAGPTTPNSGILLDLDEAGLANVVVGDRFEIKFLNLDTVVQYPLGESDSFVMNYSMVSDEDVNGLKVRRVGTLKIVADEYSVAILDEGVDLNQDTNINNFMRIIWSGHIEDVGGIPYVVLTLTNASYYPVSITFSGTRWAHSSQE